MKKTITRLCGAVFAVPVVALLLTSFTAEAQTTFASVNTIKSTTYTDSAATDKAGVTTLKLVAKPADAPWTPVRRLWGYTFGDFYYAPKVDPGNRGAETNYIGVAPSRNAFQFRRVYLGYDYDIDKKFSVELLLASEPSANTNVNGATAIPNGDDLVDGKMAFYIKNINLRWKSIFKGTDFVIGEMATPAFSLLSEKIWSYRSIEKTVADFHKTNSFDVGAALQGVFDPATKNFGYDFMIGNNSQANLLAAGTANANTGFFKAFYGDIYGKFLDQKLIIDVYADYAQTASTITTTTPEIGAQSHSMLKGFVAYTTPKFTVGLEAYTNKITNGVTTSPLATPAVKNVTNATVQAFSAYVRGVVLKDKLNFFARYDGYNPNTGFDNALVYANNTNLSSYNAYAKEQFTTFGLDFTPSKTVHFMPNFWYINYKDLRDASTTGYIAPGHTAVARLTFYYVFGK